MIWVDVLRALCVVMAIPLAIGCTIATLHCKARDQRLRFLSLALLGVVVVAWQIEAWGHPLHWRVPLLAIALATALVGTAMFLFHKRRDQED